MVNNKLFTKAIVVLTGVMTIAKIGFYEAEMVSGCLRQSVCVGGNQSDVKALTHLYIISNVFLWL